MVEPAQAHPANTGAPAAWLVKHAHLIKPRAQVLDLACGSGRHLRWLAAQGHAVTGVDRDAAALGALAGLGRTVLADIENGPWPLSGELFDAVVVTNYLWRPLLPHLQQALAPGGVLIYETFADGHQSIGRPSRPDFLLQPGELLRSFASLRVVAYEDGYEAAAPRFVQRLVAVQEASDVPAPARYALPT